MTTESVRVGQLKKKLRIFHAGRSTGTIEVNCQNLKETKSKESNTCKAEIGKKNYNNKFEIFINSIKLNEMENESKNLEFTEQDRKKKKKAIW